MLGAYLGIVGRAEPGVEEPLTLGAADIAALSTALAVEPEQVTGRISELLAWTTRLRSYRRQRRRKRILSGAGLIIAFGTVAGFGVGALVAALPSKAEPITSTAPAATTTVVVPTSTVAPSTTTAASTTTVRGVVEHGTTAAARRWDDTGTGHRNTDDVADHRFRNFGDRTFDHDDPSPAGDQHRYDTDVDSRNRTDHDHHKPLRRAARHCGSSEVCPYMNDWK